MGEEFGMIDEVPFMNEDGAYVEDEVDENDMDAENRIVKIRGWEAYRKRWLEHYERKIAEVNERADRNIAWHKYHLFRFFQSVPHKTTKTTMFYDGLPGCKLVVNKAVDKINKPSKDNLDRILLKLAEDGDREYIKRTVTEEVDWTKYKQNLAIVDGKVVDTRTGEIVDDVEITHVEPELALKFKDDMKEMDENDA